MILRAHNLGAAAAALILAGAATPQMANAGNDALLGAVGGLLAGKMLSDHEQKRQAEAYQRGADEQYIAQQQSLQQQAYANQQGYVQGQQAAAQSPEARLAKLKSLKDQGLITEADYNQQKAAIISSL